MTTAGAVTGPRRFATAAEGLAAEGGLLRAAREGQQGGLVWSSARPALVAPTALSRRPGYEGAAANSAARGWPVHLRPTGGGVTPQAPGIVNLALAGPADGLSTEAAYRRLCDLIATALAGLGIATATGALAGSFCDGRWNLLCRGRKIAGTAQRWVPRRPPQRGWCLLAHAVILDDVALAAPLAAIDDLSADLQQPATSGPSAHTTVADERAPGCGTRLDAMLAARAGDGFRQG
ncbi:lipoyl protein ligase domain-containing protein [Acidimangrovimonas pyrenivorans]|uniref:BPL/LPL catalytic domain-containing protein n=1 Tax=Acidimangrovimonas pyrenivorans TaxID=2030798 RepID=A0ABV7AF10_9RHOB